MPSFSDLLANNPYDGDPLDGSEVIALLEDDEGLLEGITTQQLANLLPYDWSALTSYGGYKLNGTEILPLYEDNEGIVEGITVSQVTSNLATPVQVGYGVSPPSNVMLTLESQTAGLTTLMMTELGANTPYGCGLEWDGGDTDGILRFQTRDNNGLLISNVMEMDLRQGIFSAPTKNFYIDHPNPDKSNTHTLRHGSLEGPENGVYQRGTLDGSAVIDLPSYWPHLVDETTITVNLTPLKGFQKLYVKSKSADKIEIGIEGGTAQDIHCDYTVYAERSDVDSLTVEEEK